MTKKFYSIAIWIAALLPVAILAVLYGTLPAQVPMQWGFDGAVHYGDRAELWLVVLMSPLMAALFRVLPRVDPRHKNYAKFRDYYDGFCLVLLLFLMGMDALVLVETLRPGTVAVERVVTMGVGLLFVFLGNLLPKVKNNFFMGVRTPWTLSDPDIWNRSNRLGGILFFGFGIVMLCAGLLLPERVSFVLMMIGTGVVALSPVLLSYIWYRQKHTEDVDNHPDQ